MSDASVASESSASARTAGMLRTAARSVDDIEVATGPMESTTSIVVPTDGTGATTTAPSLMPRPATRPRRVPVRGRSRLLNGRYELGEMLGSGGMGTVYRAVDHRLGRSVAIKMLHSGGHGTEGYRRRLESEAAIVATLRHPSIAQVHDYDEDRGSRDRTPFVVMELVDGLTLSQYVRRHGPLPLPHALGVVREIARALDYLQALGVVHRDLKPANIMLSTDGRLILVDFGIAHAPTSQTLTTTGAILGTVEYVSPEQIGGGAATFSSDLYALGLIAYHCLTGDSPFRRSSSIASAYAQINDPLPGLPDSIPEPVRRMVESLSAKQPSQRPGSARDVLDALDAHVIQAELPPVSAEDVSYALPVPPASPFEAAPTSRRRRVAPYLAAAALLAVAGLVTGEVKSADPADAADPVEPRIAEVTPIYELEQTPEPAALDPAVATTPQTAPADPMEAATVAPPDQASPVRGNGNGSGNGNGNAGNGVKKDKSEK